MVRWGRWIALVGLLGWVIAPSLGLAAWITNTNGPDVFGDTTVFAINAKADGTGLVLKCNQDELLQIAYLVKTGKMDSDVKLPATLLLQFGKSTPISLTAELRIFNDDYVGVIAEGRSADMLNLVKVLGSARDKISVGIKIGDLKQAATFDVSHAAEASKTMLKACKLDVDAK